MRKHWDLALLVLALALGARMGYFQQAASAPRWHTPDRIVVIESDDWGNNEVFKSEADAEWARKAFAACLPASGNLRWYGACRDTPDDIARLSAVLRRHKDTHGRCPAVTANVIVGKLDWAVLDDSGCPDSAIVRYDRTQDAEDQRLIAAWRRAFQEQVFMPQLHGLTHYNLEAWQADVRIGGFVAAAATRQVIPSPSCVGGQLIWYGVVYLGDNVSDSQIDRLVREGHAAFVGLFGFPSLSTIAPSQAWDVRAERAWTEVGIKYVQSGARRTARIRNGRAAEVVRSSPGTNGPTGLLYLDRNCAFEPNSSASAASDCLREVARAFRMQVPAVIETHSDNYCGSIDPGATEHNRTELDGLLCEIERRWPDVQYLTTPELGEAVETGSFHCCFTGQRRWVRGYDGRTEKLLHLRDALWLLCCANRRQAVGSVVLGLLILTLSVRRIVARHRRRAAAAG